MPRLSLQLRQTLIPPRTVKTAVNEPWNESILRPLDGKKCNKIFDMCINSDMHFAIQCAITQGTSRNSQHKHKPMYTI